MIFLRPWVLPLLAVVAVWAAWEWRQTHRRGGLILKALVAALVVTALAQPRLSVFEERVALAMLADTSASVPGEDLRKQADLAGSLAAARGRHSLQIIGFAGEAQRLPPDQAAGRAPLGSEGRATNLEAGIRAALSALPEGRVPRLLVASDGLATHGSVERALYQAHLLGVPVDTVALEGTPRPALRVDSVSIAGQAFTGEKFPIEMVVTSPRAAAASIEVTAEGKRIGGAQIRLAEGQSTLRVRAQIDAEGATLVSGAVSAAGLGQARFDRVVALRRPRALWITAEPAETTRHLRQTLDAARFEVTASTGALPGDLRPYQLLLADNHDLESWSVAQKRQVEDYVQEGGGFALIAGERNVYVERKPGEEDLVERMLPARLAPPRTPEGTAVVLIMDKSSSMEGKKMELARLSAIGVVDNLRPIDQVGILIFDNSFQWAVPVRKADNPAQLKRIIAGITPDGGTQIAPALGEGFRQIRRTKAIYRHIVLLTDGISEEGDSMALAKEAASAKVTISTVGLGQDVNRAYLDKVAALAKGKSYFVLELGALEQLLLRDVREHTGSSAVEKPAQVAVARPAEILEGAGMEQAPPLLGYLKFVAKPQAETILEVDEKDPLLARWQYGLGRAAVFASDAKARWAVNWVAWPGYDRFWTNLLRDLLPRAAAGESSAEFDAANGQIVARYRFAGGAAAAPEEVYAVGPDGFRKAAPLQRVAAASYEARVPIEGRQGMFRIRPSPDAEGFPEIGYYQEEAELAQFGSNAELLRQVAQSTGGRFNPTPQQAFEAGGRTVETTLELWPGLLALALVANLLELAARKGYGLRWLRWRAARPA